MLSAILSQMSAIAILASSAVASPEFRTKKCPAAKCIWMTALGPFAPDVLGASEGSSLVKWLRAFARRRMMTFHLDLNELVLRSRNGHFRTCPESRHSVALHYLTQWAMK